MSTIDATDATVIINVIDVNEKPVFREFYFLTIDETEAVDTELSTVSAQDEDEGTNGMLLYSIVSGNDEDKFRLNEVRGFFMLRINLKVKETM